MRLGLRCGIGRCIAVHEPDHTENDQSQGGNGRSTIEQRSFPRDGKACITSRFRRFRSGQVLDRSRFVQIHGWDVLEFIDIGLLLGGQRIATNKFRSIGSEWNQDLDGMILAFRVVILFELLSEAVDFGARHRIR